MRTIKFKAKRLDNGEWVYGDLLKPCTQARIVNYDESSDDAIKRADYHYFDIDNATICQFTGLLDCNGREIYEGDIVCITIEPTFETAETNNRNADLMGIEMPSWVNGGDIIARVSYFDCAFHFIHLQSYMPQCGEHVQEPMLNYLCFERHPEMHKSYNQTIEVIGNVFDNPELLTDKLNKQ